MKSPHICMILALLAIFLGSCDTKSNQETEEEATTDTITQAPAPPANDLNSDQSALLETILGDDAEGTILRGIAFGDGVAKVKATETFEMFEETADHLGYTSETEQLETIDVQYFLSPDKKVNRITVDVYLNSPQATKQLWNAGKAYFTNLYEKPKEAGKTITWNAKSVRVNMEDVSKGKDFGLKFQFAPTDKNVLAVN